MWLDVSVEEVFRSSRKIVRDLAASNSSAPSSTG